MTSSVNQAGFSNSDQLASDKIDEKLNQTIKHSPDANKSASLMRIMGAHLKNEVCQSVTERMDLLIGKILVLQEEISQASPDNQARLMRKIQLLFNALSEEKDLLELIKRC